MKIYPYLLLVVALLTLPLSLSGQDATFDSFRGHESAFNPAFTGQIGASRLTATSRSQWGNTAVSSSPNAGYQTRAIAYEEGLPCLFFDYGLYLRQDTEGEGRLTNTEAGGRFAIALPLVKATDRALNLRLGLSLGRGQRSIDYAGLVFLDQLDPVRGLLDPTGGLTPTGFVPANIGSTSPWYTTSALGFALKGGRQHLSKRLRDHPLLYSVGLAVHNWSGLASRDGRQTISFTGLDAALQERWVGSANAEIAVAKKNKRYWSLHPQIIAQRQGKLSYLEVGSGISWNRSLELGFYHHFVGEGADWSTLRANIGVILPDEYTRVDLGLGWSLQYGALKNYVAAPFELTAAFSFGRSLTCLAVGEKNDFVRGRKGSVDCFSFGTANHRIYDNIWNQ